MKTSLLLGLGLSVSLLCSHESAFADAEKARVKVGDRIATLHHKRGVKPTDFITYGAGESEEFLGACFTGDPEKVEKVLKNICKDTKWDIEKFQVVSRNDVYFYLDKKRSHEGDDVDLPRCSQREMQEIERLEADR